MATKKFNYNEAIQSIEQILERFRNEELDVDTLSEEVKRATTLIASCRERLTKVEEEVNKILDAE
ncbi:MAG: exodeoxyribonuclease VII small subunit [Alistipes sp.]|nr:exodeoxyribonuclease VII small subunit [Rikenellaceae bacterium]MBO5187931.1 exodeoxyribonuclease VII small subunit [Alistipes sp.]MBQ2727895.1 exodeoxyribonuclease VII small subunit [Alistipes sp.]MBQ3082351.1 exodeoxyribonuclease VII small subunit [Alistipes sp.]MBQ8471406.1 exodeoxyribonuclease VII small subunit [Alistipes sp.]